MTSESIFDWWHRSFSEADRQWMIATFQPLTISVTASAFGSDTTAKVVDVQPLERTLRAVTEADALSRLSLLSTWFSKPGYEHCAVAFARKATEYAAFERSILERHFAYANLCITLYRWRDIVPGALDGAVDACLSCIAIQREAAEEARAHFGFVPAHHCFRQLRIIEEKRGNLDRAIELCEQARAGGWADDWDKDIDRLLRKRAKTEGKRS